MAFGAGTFSTTQRKPYQRGLGMPQQPAAQPAQPGQLQAPQPLTANGAMAQQKNLQGIQTGQFGDVQSAQNATNRAGALRQYQAIQSSRAGGIRGNLSTEQAQRAQDQSLAAANAQNLTAQNSVNALQRQYGQDALNRADTYENTAYSRGTNERAYGDSRSDLGYDRATDQARYGDSRGDVAFGQDMQTQQFGANRQDAAFSQGLAKDQFSASRDDALYSRGYQQSRDQVGDQRYDQSYQDSRGDLAYDRNINESRYGDTRADVKYGQDYQASRDAVGDTRYNQSYADTRGDVAYSRDYQASRDTVGDSRYTDETSYSRGRDTVGDQRYADTTQYTRGRDTVADQRYDASTAYSQGRDAIGDQRYDASIAYSQNRDALGDQRYNQTYQDSRGDVSYNRGESKRLEGKSDTNALISSVTDPRAQNLLRSVQASGGDVQAMYNTMLDQGTIKEEYRSASPGESAVQAKIDELKSYYPGKTDAEIQQMALDERTQDRALTQRPLETATKEQAAQDAEKRLNNGEAQAGDFETALREGKVQKYTPANLPIDNGAKALIGKTISIGNKQYQVVANGRVTNKDAMFGTGSHTSYTVVQSPDGKVMYNYNGTMNEKPPVTKMGKDAGKSAVYNPTTKTTSYVKV